MPYKLTSSRLQTQRMTSLEKELKELKTKAVAKEEKEEEISMGPGLGGRLMIGGP